MSKNLFFIGFICLSFVLSGCSVSTPTRTAANGANRIEIPRHVDAAGKLVNAYRERHGLPPVFLNDTLITAAKQQSTDMQQMHKMVHRSRKGETLDKRLTNHGYDFCAAGENIAQGYYNDAKVIRAWDQSAPHRRTLLNPYVSEYGMVRVGDYYTLIMGSRC